METDSFRNFNATYGLDSQVVVSYFKAFASYLLLNKDGKSFMNLIKIMLILLLLKLLKLTLLIALYQNLILKSAFSC